MITLQVNKSSLTMNLLKETLKCPICLELLTKTMLTCCMHRFCKECIMKVFSYGKQCPVCRAFLSTKRTLREDPTFDTIIGLIEVLTEKQQNVESKKRKCNPVIHID